MLSFLLIMFWVLIFCLVAIGLFQASVTRMNYFKACFDLGLIFWRGFLPSFSAVVVAFLMLTSLAGVSNPGVLVFKLNNYFQATELAILLALSPLLFVRFNNMFAVVLLLYCLIKLILMKTSPHVNPGMLILIFTLINLAILGDYQPWLNRFVSTAQTQKVREVLLLVLALAALMSLFFILANVGSFNRWLENQYSLRIPLWQTTLGVIMLIIGWLSVALGFSRSFSLPLLISCTMAIFSFILILPNFILMLPFAAGLALSFTKQYQSLQLR